MRRMGTNLLIVTVLVYTAVAGFQPVFRWHHSLQQALYPPVTLLGAWQTWWSMFTPVVYRKNNRLTVEYELQDGTLATWSGRNWGQMSSLAKLAQFRETACERQLCEGTSGRVYKHFAKSMAKELSLNPTDIKWVRIRCESRVTPAPWPEDPQDWPPTADALEEQVLFEGVLP